MIGYITFGTNDLERARHFYDEFFLSIDIKRLPGSDQFPAWGKSWAEPPALCVVNPFDKQAATHGNGVMVALSVHSTEQVDTAYRRAIELGAQSEGAPGPRGTGGFYAGYFRDPDGNKLNVYCH
jgi:catechol 2,3-dioxygenase-like lactoylglutathione lyase family enzyme